VRITTETIDQKRLADIRKTSKSIITVGFVAFLAMICYSGYQLYWMNKEIAGKDRQMKEATATLRQLSLEIEAKQNELTILDKRILLLNDALSILGNENPGLAQRVAGPPAMGAPEEATMLPRIYIHIQDHSQRAMAKRVAEQLTEQGYVVPGIERIDPNRSPNATQFRYFRLNELEFRDAEEIVRVLRGMDIAVKDVYVPGYEGTSRMEPRHYEIWFGSES